MKLKQSGALIATAAYFIALATLGGGPAAWSTPYILLILIIAVVALGVAGTDGFKTLDRVPLIARIALVGVAVLPLLQLLVLPPAVWQALPGQELRGEVLALMGLKGTWQPLTLDAVGTAISAILAVGFLQLIILLMRLDDAAFGRILDVALAVVVLNIAIGVLQVASDGQYPRLHGGNMGPILLGMLANKNHTGLVIACGMVLFGLVTSLRIADLRRRYIAVASALLFGFICIVTTNSRAALVLGTVGALAVLAHATRAVAWRYRLGAAAALAGFAALLLPTQAFEVVSMRLGDVNDDVRWQITGWSMPLVERYWLLGSGAGSFSTLFNADEQLAWVGPSYINAIHNDYLQLAMEMGLPGVIITILLAGSLLGGIIAWPRLSSRGPHRPQLLFGLIVLAMFAAHSAIDYPLRRPACWIFFALALACVYRARWTAREAA